MWNVTDEVPKNCEIFVTCRGIDLFLKCKERLLENSELVRNMVGVLGNLAETQTMRSLLMTKEILQELEYLLKSNNEEISYYTGGILANLASQGRGCWTIEYPEREQILLNMVRTIQNMGI